MTGRIRVDVIDRHPLFRDGVILALSSQPDIKVIGQGGSASDIIHVDHKCQSDVIVLGSSTLDCSMGVVEEILQHHPTISILILAVAADKEHVYTALKRGVRGY
jgi:two-component system nitrate/nitrite response regulator NarL